MEITLLDLFKYIKRKYVIITVFLIVGILLNISVYISALNQKKVVFVIAIDHYVWDKGIYDVFSNRQIRTNVSSRYMSFLETTKLGISSKIASSSNINPGSLSKTICTTTTSKRIVDCFINSIHKDKVEEFVESNNLVIKYFTEDEIDSQINNFNQRVVSQRSLLDSSSEITIEELNNLKDLLLNKPGTKYSISNKIPKKLNQFIMLVSPMILYLIFTLIFFPHAVKPSQGREN